MRTPCWRNGRAKRDRHRPVPRRCEPWCRFPPATRPGCVGWPTGWRAGSASHPVRILPTPSSGPTWSRRCAPDARPWLRAWRCRRGRPRSSPSASSLGSTGVRRRAWSRESRDAARWAPCSTPPRKRRRWWTALSGREGSTAWRRSGRQASRWTGRACRPLAVAGAGRCRAIHSPANATGSTAGRPTRRAGRWARRCLFRPRQSPRHRRRWAPRLLLLRRPTPTRCALAFAPCSPTRFIWTPASSMRTRILWTWASTRSSRSRSRARSRTASAWRCRRRGSTTGLRSAELPR